MPKSIPKSLSDIFEVVKNIQDRCMTLQYEVGRLRDSMDIIRTAQVGGELIMAADLASLQAKVAENTSVTGSVLTFIQGLQAALEAAKTAGGFDATAVQAIIDQLDANDVALVQATVANTPAAGEPVPPTA